MPTSVPSDPSSAAGPADTPDTPDTATARRRQRRARRWWWLGGSAAVLIIAVVAASFIRVPYYTLAPGSMRVTEPHVSVDGAEIHRDDAGDIGYMTVTFAHASVLGLVWGSLHPDIEVLGEREALGGRDRDENREINVQMMAGAKEVSTAVALEAVGYDVDIVGTGAHVVQVEPDSPADGILADGDTIVAVNDTTVELADDLVEMVSQQDPGAELTLTIEHGEEDATRTEVVELGPREDDPDSGFLGVLTVTRDGAFDFPVDVTIDSGDVIGPSAGLAFSLTLIDLLTPGSLTGEERLAVTGTIDVEGNVGRVGGVEQKTVAASSAGATIFFVPEEEAEVATDRAGSDLQVVGVATLDDALEALVELTDASGVVPQIASGRSQLAD